MLSVAAYPLGFVLIILFAGFSELAIFNEEVLILLCFIAFCTNAFVYARESTFTSLNQRAESQKTELSVFTNVRVDARADTLNFNWIASEKTLCQSLIRNVDSA